MANSKIHIGAEFDSFEDFKKAFDDYCENTKVNGEPVKFVHSSCSYIKNDSFQGDEQQRLKYVMKAERCKFAGTTSCKAAYKLVLHSKANVGHVLRLVKFHGEHSSHIKFHQYDEKLVAKPKNANLSNNNNSKGKLQSIVKKIHDGIKNLSDAKCDSIAEILENLWERTEKDITYKVDFTDNPTTENQYNVGIVRVGSTGTRSGRRKANEFPIVGTIEINDTDDDEDDNDNDDGKNSVLHLKNEKSSESEESVDNSSSNNSENTNSESLCDADDETMDDDHTNDAAAAETKTSESEASQSDESEQSHDESSQDQSMGTPEPVPKTHSTESNDNNTDSESSDDSGDDSMNDDHVDPSDQPPESLANESIDSNQSKQIFGTSTDSNNNKSKDIQFSDDSKNDAIAVVVNEPKKSVANESLVSKQSEQSNDIGSNHGEIGKNTSNVNSEDADDESSDDEHTKIVVEGEQKEGMAKEPLVSDQNEQSIGIGSNQTGNVNNSKDSESPDDSDVEMQMSEADVTSPAIEKVESERLYELEMDDFLGTLYLQPTGQKRSNKCLELDEDRPSKKTLRLADEHEAILNEP